jgi:hypothetical protein
VQSRISIRQKTGRQEDRKTGRQKIEDRGQEREGEDRSGGA